MVPVSGKVSYRGEPLKFGKVTFQPAAGLPSSGDIQPDGTFVLSCLKPGDGARVGTHRVMVSATERHRDAAAGASDELSTSKSLIPEQYENMDTSGIEREVVAGEPNHFEIDLQ